MSKPKSTFHETDPCHILSLPVELQMRIFVLAQNPAIVTSCKQFWELGQSVTVRAQYLLYRYGRAVLGKRSMKRKIVSLAVVEQLLRYYDPIDDWLFTYACEFNQIQLCQWIIHATVQDKILQHYVNIAAMKGALHVLDLLAKHVDLQQHQENALTLACKENQLETVQHLIVTYGCDIHFQHEKLLRNACLQGQQVLVEFILSCDGTDVHAYHDAALQNAAYKRFPSLVKVLLDAGANVQVNDNACIQHAMANKDVESIKYLVDGGVDPRWNHDWLLKQACRFGLDAVVEIWLNAVGDANIDNGLPLQVGLTQSKASILQAMLNHGADPNTPGALRGLNYLCRKNTHNKDRMMELLFQAGLKLK